MSTVTGTVAADWGVWDVEVDVTPGTVTGTVAADWGGMDAHATAGSVGVAVFDQDGVWQANVASPLPQWKHRLSMNGAATLKLPLDDPAASSITDRSILKFAYKGGYRFAAHVSAEQCSLVTTSNKWLTINEAPGLLHLLHDAVVKPEGGQKPTSGDTRTFGAMSVRGPWYVPSDWVRPAGFRMKDDPTARLGFPADMLTNNPYWIAPPPGPATDQPAGKVARYRWEFTTTTVKNIKFICSYDNYGRVYLDGEEVISPDYSDPYTWRQSYDVTVTLQPGPHVFYAEVENAARTRGLNPLGFIMYADLLDDAGNYAGKFAETDLTHWWCTFADVGWYPAQVLYQLVTEARALGRQGPSALTLGFSPIHDSHGVVWSGDRDEYSFDVNMTFLDDAATQLAVAGMDVDVLPDLTLVAYNRMGSDKSGTVTLATGDGGNLTGFDTNRTSTRFTVATARLADGRWSTVTDSAGVAAVGSIEAGVSLGSTSSPTTAHKVLLQALATSAQPVVSTTAKTSTGGQTFNGTSWVAVGPQMIDDYGLGDSVTTPGHRGVGTMKQRITAENVDATGPRVLTFPEMIEDPS